MKFTLSWLKEHLDTTASLDEITEALTGRRSERTEWSIVGGAAMLVAGAVLAGAALVRARG